MKALRGLAHETWWWIKRIPWTVGLIAANIVAGITTCALWRSADSLGLTERWGWGLPDFRHGDFSGIFTGLLVAPEPWMYILILAPVAIGGGYLEYHYGALRMLAALIATHIASVLLVALLLFGLENTSLVWAQELSKSLDVGLSNAGFGALGAATAALPLLWRRRIRIILFLYAVSFLLFSGIIWDLTHFTALLVGFAIGPWVVRRAYNKPSFKLSKQEARNAVAVLVVFYVITRLTGRLYPGNGGLLGFHHPGGGYAATMLVTLGLSIFLLLMAYGLYAGRRVAWWFSLIAITVLIIDYLIIPSSAVTIFNLILTGSIFILLLVCRKAFDVAPDKLVRRTVFRRIGLLAGGLLVFNALGIYAIRHDYQPHPSFAQAAAESVYQIVGVSTRSFEPDTNLAKFYTESISYAWLVAFFMAVIALVFTTLRQRDDARALFDDYDHLLHQTGCSDIGWMARWEGMAYWTNLDKTAGFAYRLENNIAVVLGDPVGRPKAVAAALESFETMCLRRGWRPIYYAISDGMRTTLKAQKFKHIQIGEDTVIDLPELEFAGKSWQSVRSAVNRAHKDGVRMRVIRLADAPVGLRDQLATIADGWVKDKSLPEMGFTLGTLKEAEDPEVRMHIAVDEDGTVHGMTSWFPVYRDGKIAGWTIDIMQRRLHDQTMPGVMEFLIAESATTFKQEGYSFISLSAAPLSRSGKPANAIELLLDVVAKRMEPYYGFKSLYNFKQKFKPRHEPLYLLYRDEARLPAIALAIGKAYMPDHAVRELIAAKIRG